MGEAPPLEFEIQPSIGLSSIDDLLQNTSGSNYSDGMTDDSVVSSELWSRENSSNLNVEIKQRIDISDDTMMIGEQSDSFLVDLERFSGCAEKDVNEISPLKLQRSISRKMNHQSGGHHHHHHDTTTSIGVASVYPSSYSTTSAATQVLNSNSASITPEKPLSPRRQPVMGSTTDGYHLPHHQHPITIKTAYIPTNTSTSAETPAAHITRWGTRRFKRTPSSCFSDPKRVLLFFATLSSIGTIMLIFFTPCIGMTNDSG